MDVFSTALGLKPWQMHVCGRVNIKSCYPHLKLGRRFSRSTKTFSNTDSNSKREIENCSMVVEGRHCESLLVAGSAPICHEPTLGQYLARKLVDVGVKDVFGVPGDFNLILLDYLIEQPGLSYIGCCNELNAGYAADGYARHRGIGACVATFTVGGLSLLNAIAGAYSENLPVICIVGAPNTNDYGSRRILHHTIGLPDFSQEHKCFQTVTCYQAIIDRLDGAQAKIDKAFAMALTESKPVYISICCNLVAIPHPTFSSKSIPFTIPSSSSNKRGLEAAVEAAAAFLNKAEKPVMIADPKLKTGKSCEAFMKLAEACGYPISVMPSAKGLVPENHSRFIGTYWGAISSPCCAEIVESADAYLVVGPIFSDSTTANYSQFLRNEISVLVEHDRVMIGSGGPSFGCVLMKEFLERLAEKMKKNTTAFENHRRIFVPRGSPLKGGSFEPIRVNILFGYIQKMLTTQTTVIVEAGDSLFNCQKLKLPQSCGYESQLMYCSIGWSVGATLGYAQSAPEKRVISLIGDGSFQVKTEHDLIRAIKVATKVKQDSLCFIEVFTHKDDTSKELLNFGLKAALANSRPHNPL